MRRRPLALASLASALLAGLGGLLLLSLAPDSATAQGTQGRALRKFMRQKLEYTQNVLEGLTLEDYALIARNARALRELSQDAQWRVSPNMTYLRLSTEFQRLADEVADQARQRNLDATTQAYFRLTSNCIACHKLVRDERLLSRADPARDTPRAPQSAPAARP